MPTSTGQKLLREFLKENDLADARVGEVIGVSRPTVHDWLTGAKRPRTAYRKMIAAWTRGAVPEDAWTTTSERRKLAAVKPFESGTQLPDDEAPTSKAAG